MISFSLALASVLAFLLSDPQTPPNFYPGLVSAREASKESQKEMIIFFSDKTCSTCESGWLAFIKDARATEHYISTRMDISDFDGGIFFDLLDLKQVPSWIILLPDGTEKERWEGGWKDETGRPVKYEMAVTQVPSKPEIKTSTSPQKTAPPTVVTTKQNTPSATETNSNSVHGFILQAGFFGSEMNAQKMIADMKSKDINGYEIKSVQQNSAMFYRVVSKVFNTESDLNKEQQRLSGAGFKTSVKEF